MIIEFPKKYSVIPVSDTIFFVTVPVESVKQVRELIKQQPWVLDAFAKKDQYQSLTGEIDAFTSEAYEITRQQPRTH